MRLSHRNEFLYSAAPVVVKPIRLRRASLLWAAPVGRWGLPLRNFVTDRGCVRRSGRGAALGALANANTLRASQVRATAPHSDQRERPIEETPAAGAQALVGVELGEAVAMVCGVAEGHLDDAGALDEESGVVLVGHADSTVHLHHLIRD